MYNKKMRAAIVKSAEIIEIENIDIPECGPDDVLIEIKSCAICSSDIRVIKYPGPGQPPYGKFIPGHEYSGVIVEVGEQVDEFNIGDRVTTEAHYGCGRCSNCRRGLYTSCLNWGDDKRGHRANGKTTPGGFAEYVVNHVSTVYKIPDSISFDEASLITNAGCVLYGFEKSGGYIVGDNVAVIGDGSIGLISVQIAKVLGADNVTLFGLDNYKMELGKKFGADKVFNFKTTHPVRLLKESPNSGVDFSIEASGSDSGIAAALELPKWGGKSLLIGIPKTGDVTADFKDFIRGNKNIYTVRGEGLSSCGRAVSLLKNKRLNLSSLITHNFKLAEINEAIDIHQNENEMSIKVIINPR